MNGLADDSRQPNSMSGDGLGHATRLSSATSLDPSQRGTLGLIGLGCFCILMLSFSRPGNNPLAAGVAWGTAFGHFIASGFVLATRRDSLSRRLGFTFVWQAALGVCFFCAVLRRAPNSNEAGVALIVVLIVGLVATMVTALALGAVRRLFGVRIVRATLDECPATGSSQFSLRQLFLLTTSIAVILGIGRVLVQRLIDTDEIGLHARPVALMVLLALATVLTQIPNWLALLSSRWWGAALTTTLVLTAVVVAAEPALVTAIVAGGLQAQITWVLVSINGFATGWVLAFAALFRRAGYRVVRRSPLSPKFQSPENAR